MGKMMMTAGPTRLLARKFFVRAFSTDLVTDKCSLNLVYSPFPSIPAGPYPPLYEFVTSHWKPHGGYLDEQVAIVDGSTNMKRTFREYFDTARGFAGTLSYDMGIDETGTVAVYCPNHVDYLPITLAISLCGAKITPINPIYTSLELETVLDRSCSSVLIAHSSNIAVAMQAASKCRNIKHVVVVADPGEPVPEGTIHFDSLRNHSQAFSQTLHSVHPKTDMHPLSLPYSSGTTGLPKGVCLSHANLVANLWQLDGVEGLVFPPGETLISPLPFFHIYGFTASLLYAAWKGNPIVTMSKRFDLETFCQLVQDYRPTRGHLVPPILVGLAKSPLVDKFDMSSLRTVISAAAPLGKETEEAVKVRLGCDVKQAWGMSELSPLGTMTSDFNIKRGSIGPLVGSTFGKVVDERGNSLGPNQEGELMIKGPQVMMGYLNDPEKTAECLSSSGWLRTGDVAYYDEGGMFYITDRIKELIKVRGFQVPPAELEALLLTHEAVNDAAVIQVEDADSGELPRAYVVRKDSPAAAAVTEQDLYEWVKARVAPFKRLDGGVVFTDAIPRSASGKILRRILRDQLKDETKQPG